MFGAALELLPSSHVDFAISACILKPKVLNLIVVKSNVLEIYYVTDTDKLVLASCHPFGEAIISIEKIPITSSVDVDRLILGFLGSKFSIISFSSKINDFLTLSMHCYENDSLLEASKDFTAQKMSLDCFTRRCAVDPEGNVVIFRLDGGNWSLLKLKDEKELGFSTENPTLFPRPNSQVFSSKAIDERLCNALDFCFLDGFYEPTMAILFETEPSWPGRLAFSKDTVELLIVTLNVKTGLFIPISHQTRFPCECRTLLSLSKSTGGVLLIGPNIVIHTDHMNSPTYRPLSHFAEVASSSIPSSSGNLNAMDGCIQPKSIQMITKELALCSSDRGKWYWLEFKKGSRGLSSIDFCKADMTSVEHSISSVCVIGNSWLFSAAQTGECKLFRIGNSFEERTHPNNMSHVNGEDDLDSFYRDDILNDSAANKVELSLVFEFSTLGLISGVCFGNPENDTNLYTAGGLNGIGQLNIISPFVASKPITSFELEGAKRMFVIYAKSNIPKFLVVSTSTSSMLLECIDDSMIEMEKTSFDLQSPTLLAEVTHDDTIIQVRDKGILTLTSDTKQILGNLEIPNSQPLVFAKICGNILICLDSDGSPSFYKINGQIEPVMLDGALPLRSIDFIDVERLGDSSYILAFIVERRTFVTLLLGQDNSFQILFSSSLIALLPQIVNHQNISNQPEDMEQVPTFKAMGLLRSPTKNIFVTFVTEKDDFICYRLEESKMVKVHWHGSSGFAMLSTRLLPVVETSTFKDFLGVNGFFLPGPHPGLVCIGQLGFPRLHALKPADDDVVFITMFGRDKLLLLNSRGKISLRSVDSDTQLDCSLPFVQKHLPQMLHRIVFHQASDTFCVVTSQNIPFCFPDDEYSAISDNVEWKPLGSIEKGQLASPLVPKMQLKLLSPVSWTFVDSFDLEPYENISTFESCSLTTKETTKGKKVFLCAGASGVKGEDRPVRGRVLIFDVMDVVPEPGRPETNHRFKLLTSTEMKSPVSGLADINGYLAVSCGVKTIIHEFEDNETLTGVAFTDCGVYISSTLSLKNFLILGDFQRGLHFYGFQEKPPKVLELSRDASVVPKPILHTSFMIDGTELLFVTADEGGTLSFFTYAPTNMASSGGERLIKRGAFALHQPVVQLLKVPIRLGNERVGIGVLYVTVRGEIGMLTAISEAEFRSLFGVQTKITQEVPHPAGLHPRASRSTPSARNFIDGAVIERLFDFPLLTRSYLSSNHEDPVEILKSVARGLAKAFH